MAPAPKHLAFGKKAILSPKQINLFLSAFFFVFKIVIGFSSNSHPLSQYSK